MKNFTKFSRVPLFAVLSAALLVIGLTLILTGCPPGTGPCSHTWVDGAVITEPTCETEGSVSQVCSECAAEGTPRVIVALGHDWDEDEETWTQTSATCEEAGGTKAPCKRDGCDAAEVRGEQEDALGHDESGADATCTADKVCARDGCEHVLTLKSGHDFTGSWKYNDTQHWRQCKNDGYTEEDTVKVNHNWGAWTVTGENHTRSCTDNCGVTAQSHDPTWGNWQSKDETHHHRACTHAGCDITDEAEHTPGDSATCADPEICEDCGYVINTASHNYVEGICSECNAIDIGNEYFDTNPIGTAINTALGSADEVKVIGERTDFSETINITIPANKTVIWTASLTGNERTSASNNVLVNLTATAGGTTVSTTSTLDIQGGAITAAGNNGVAIRNNGSALIKISGEDTVITSANNSSNGTIVLSANGGRLHMTGGTVSNTFVGSFVTTAYTINNLSPTTDDAVDISGGTVSAVSGFAITSAGNFGGRVNISGDALITSANTSSSGGTIRLTGTSARLKITGGTVRNTAVGSDSARVISTNTLPTRADMLEITGGTVGAMTAEGVETTGIAIDNQSNAGIITISGDALITSGNTSIGQGTIVLRGGTDTLSMNMTGGTVRNTADDRAAAAIHSTWRNFFKLDDGTVDGRIRLNASSAENRPYIIIGENWTGPINTSGLDLRGENNNTTTGIGYWLNHQVLKAENDSVTDLTVFLPTTVQFVFSNLTNSPQNISPTHEINASGVLAAK